MNNDIKEILDRIKKVANKETASYNALMEMENTKYQLLLDYITNLQEEVKEYEMIFDTFSSRPYAHRYLEEKRKELNEPHIIGLDSEMIYKDYYDLKEEHNKCTRKHWQQKCAEHCTNEMIYKSRIDKAIEILKLCNSKCAKETIDILRGKDEQV